MTIMEAEMNTRALQIAAVLSVAIYLVPLGAHLFEMPAKMQLTPAEYMTVQRIYAGWAWFAILIMAALVLALWHTFLVRGSGAPFVYSLLSFLALAATQALFWMFTYPMNVASRNWTVMPEPFEAARMSWEYSHAANALLTFMALVFLLLGIVRGPGRPREP